jgi:hypothetical protein
MFGKHQSWSESWDKGKNPFPVKNQILVIQPAVCHFTDSAITAHSAFMSDYARLIL